MEVKKLRIGFKGKNQVPLIMIWREFWEEDEVLFAECLFVSDWLANKWYWRSLKYNILKWAIKKLESWI